jgi:site-specific recombinase XerD
MKSKYTMYKSVKREDGVWRYRRAAYHPNGKIKINTVIVNGQEEVHEEGSYYAGHAGAWLPLGDDALAAEKKAAILRRGIRAVPEKNTSRSETVSTPPEMATLSSAIENYLAGIEREHRVGKSVKDKRRMLTAYAALINKENISDHSRETMLDWKKHLERKGCAPKYVENQMMAVKTFFNEIGHKFQMKPRDWPTYKINDPEPYEPAEMAAMENGTSGDDKLLIQLFRQTGCHDQEIAHLTDADLNRATKKIIIRDKFCDRCRDCRTRNNRWKPKTDPAGYRSIPISDRLFAELTARPKGLLFPNTKNGPDQHLLRRIKIAVEHTGVKRVKLHRLRDTAITNWIRDGIDIRTVQKRAGHSNIEHPADGGILRLGFRPRRSRPCPGQ